VKTAKKKRGRPAKHKGERLSKTRAFRVRGNLDESLRRAAEAAGRSVSEEIEWRLAMSFQEEKWFANLLERKVENEEISEANAANLYRLQRLLREKGMFLLLEQISEIYGAREALGDGEKK
jgi:hypothetical protein